MKIRVIAVSKKARGWAQESEVDFLARIKNFANIEVELITPINENSLGVEKARRQEGEKLLTKISDTEFVIACERGGQSLSSEELARKIGDLKDDSRKIVFLIGGSNGLDQAVLQRADLQISFSKLTFPHELFRVMLLEQIYRACMILGNRKYHK
jgi:23S rRNA (pseudouridine1915-N3)-methyltransferase